MLTQSAGSTPFPFNSLWFSSLVLSFEITGSNTVVRSGNSVVWTFEEKKRYENPSKVFIYDKAGFYEIRPGNFLSRQNTTKFTVYLNNSKQQDNLSLYSEEFCCGKLCVLVNHTTQQQHRQCNVYGRQ